MTNPAMMQPDFTQILDPTVWFAQGRGPRYQQLYRYLKDAIVSQSLAANTQFPPERDMAAQACVSRVTVRKAIGQLATDGLLDQRHGSGSFVKTPPDNKLQQSLSSLISFTEMMQMRGYASSSRVLAAGLHTPTPTEMVALGLSQTDTVARIKRQRNADPGPLAVEVSTVPADILPDPSLVTKSLYDVMRKSGHAMMRAVQRVSAVNLSELDAQYLNMPAGTAVLQIDRTGYLGSGRPVEFTRGVYRSDIYDFVSELRLEG